LCIYIIIPIAMALIYSHFMNVDEVYPDVPDYVFDIVYPLSVMLPFMMKSIS
jgi:hypothetical protein